MSTRTLTRCVGLLAVALVACGAFAIADETQQPVGSPDPNANIKWVPVAEGKSAVWLTLSRRQFDFNFGNLPPATPKPPPDEGTIETQGHSGKSASPDVPMVGSFDVSVPRPGSFGLGGTGRSGATRGSVLSALGAVSDQLGF